MESTNSVAVVEVNYINNISNNHHQIISDDDVTTTTTASELAPTLSRKTSVPAFIRRIPSKSQLAGNATTAWTVGQQKSNDDDEELPSQTPEAKSKFMRALGKFKNKHLTHKKYV
ncbi:hypothetical protein BGZ65_008144 [Modicella reniformis]|uniref:Uncharacterized protein n=1 Tax=Modicella reniformis TaxID=1440133 RepID=A0A9P6MF85_9FUNG|nr:hypothetical protein BGZ65_008144 [Modicella reniformis]